MLLESESKRFPNTITALEAAVPLGAMLTPLGGSVRDRRGARVVTNGEEDVTGVGIAPVVPPVKDEGIMVDGVAEVSPVEAKDVAPDVSDSIPKAPPVVFKVVRIDINDSVPEAPLVEVAVGPGSVAIFEVEKKSDDIDDMGIDPIVEAGRLGSWVLLVDPLSVACAFELVIEIAVPKEPAAVPPPEPVTASDEPDAHSKDHVGDEGEEDVGLPEIVEGPTSVEG